MDLKTDLRLCLLLPLFFVHWTACSADASLETNHITNFLLEVGPPRNLQIIDHGHLGELHIQWQPPIFFKTEDECLLWYELQYYSPDQKRWKRVTTKLLMFIVHFNLEKEVKVKVQSILTGKCINGTELRSVWVETVLHPSLQGNAGSKIKNMSCMYYNRERLECRWQKGNEVPSHGYNYYLYYWHEKMDHALECSNYIKSDGYNIGCNFTGAYLIEFTDLNICVNGSSSHGNMRAAYFTYELQNIVKVDMIDKLNLTLENKRIHLEWSVASSKIPHHCLEYEVQYMKNTKEWKAIFTDETKISLFNLHRWNSLCFRIRSKINMYCADNNIWSDWSLVKCLLV
ncbi:interleukin-13 receptor subunit alpha-2-like [Polypterus senegalus]|uniref:interleukin-13 receptor subunit alpha-2-like n=1 Tax=Polypterus senegalus TaxID=55291 RepID=UPI0019650A61|nr:interleukin-13 receptor subunit alpha-2-like [Polypterus senegalus]XP_039620513.1 interleukin-13 receptor subunit alpha-2-like [Polypterus senegalus]XP_039620515.1 interleukin-13 receptor subunit alpha-2-like [Polypterus senegalus]